MVTGDNRQSVNNVILEKQVVPLPDISDCPKGVCVCVCVCVCVSENILLGATFIKEH